MAGKIITTLAIIALCSCKTTKQEPVKCCDKDTAHALWECGEDLEYEHYELITNTNR
jgi:hypothetical protein